MLNSVPFEAGSHPQSRLDFPFTPPAEYDFEIEFTLTVDQIGSVGQHFTAGDRSATWVMQAQPSWSTPVYAFQPLDGKTEFKSEANARLPRHFKKGQRYQSVVEVRKGSLQALLDGEVLVSWSGDMRRFPEGWSEWRTAKQFGIGAWGGGIIFHKATLTEFVPQAPQPPALTLPTGPTTWTDTKGRSITATFKAIASGNVLLDIAGKVTPVPLNTLSAESQKLARDLAKNADPERPAIAVPQAMGQKTALPQVPPINKSGWRSLFEERPEAFSKTPIQDLGDGWRTIQLGSKALPLLEASNAAIRLRAKDGLNLIVRWSATATRGSHGFKACVLPSPEEARLSGGIIVDVTGEKIWGFKAIRPTTLGFTQDVEYELELRAYGDQVTILVNGEVKYETSKVNLPGEWLALYNSNGPCRFKDLEWMPLDAKGNALKP